MSKALQPAKAGKSIDDFKSAHDKGFLVKKRLTDALAALGESWLYERELARMARVSTNDAAAHRELFAAYTVSVGKPGKSKTVWAGSKQLAKKLRSMVVA